MKPLLFFKSVLKVALYGLSKNFVSLAVCINLIFGLFVAQSFIKYVSNLDAKATAVNITHANIGTLISCTDDIQAGFGGPATFLVNSATTICSWNLIGSTSNTYLNPVTGPVMASMFNAVSTATPCKILGTVLTCFNINVNPNHDDPNPAAARTGTNLPIYLTTSGTGVGSNWTVKATISTTDTGTLLPADIGDGKCTGDKLFNSTFTCAFSILNDGKYLPSTNVFATFAGSALASVPCVIIIDNLVCRNILAHANFDTPAAVHTGLHTLYITTTGTTAGNWTGKGDFTISTATTFSSIGPASCYGDTVYVNDFFNCTFPLSGMSTGVYPMPGAGINASVYFGTSAATPCSISGSTLTCNNIKANFNGDNPDLTQARTSIKSPIYLSTTGVGVGANWTVKGGINIVENPNLTVTLNRATSQTGTSNLGNEIKYTATFASAVRPDSFTKEDILLSGTATGQTVKSIVQVTPFNNKVFEVSITTASEGTVNPSIIAGSVNMTTSLTSVPNGVAAPRGITTDPWGNTIVSVGPAPLSSSPIYRYDAYTGVRTLIESRNFTAPSIASDESGNVYSLSRTGSSSGGGARHGIFVTPTSGVSKFFKGRLKLESPGGNFSYLSIALDSAGNIYVASQLTHNVSKFTPEGVKTILGLTDTSPYDITIDKSGNVYTANYDSNNVTKITPAGVSTTFASTGTNPFSIAIDSAGNIVTANSGSNNITKITPAGITSTTAVTGTSPRGVSVDVYDNIYIANFGTSDITKITPSGTVSSLGAGATGAYETMVNTFGVVSTIGTGTTSAYTNALSRTSTRVLSGVKSQFSETPNLTSTTTGSLVTVNDFNVSINQSSTQVDPASTGSILKFTALFNQPIETSTFTPSDIVLAGSAPGKVVYSIAQVAPLDGTTFEIFVTTTGSGSVEVGIPSGSFNYVQSTFVPTSSLSNPSWLDFDSVGNMYTANFAGNSVTKTTPAGVSTVITDAGFVNPNGLVIDGADNVYVANYAPGTNAKVFKISPAGVVTTHGSTGDYPVTLVADTLGNVYTSNWISNTITKITPAGVSTVFTTLGASTTNPYGMAIDNSGNLFVTNLNSTDSVTKINNLGSIVATYTIPGANPDPYNVAIDSVGNAFVANANGTITKITPSGVISTVSITGGTIASNVFGIAIDPSDNIFITVGGGNVQMITPSGVISTIGNTGATANPHSIAFDSLRNVYVTNSNTAAAGGSTVTRFARTLASGIDSSTAILTPNKTATFSDNQVSLNNFSVLINQASSQVDPATFGQTIKFTAVFNAPIDVATFTSTDIVLSGTASGATVTGIVEIAPNNGTTFEISVTTTGQGTVIANIPAGTYANVVSVLASTGTAPRSLTIDSAGNIYTANYNSNNVTKITPAGVSTIHGTTGTSPISIVMDSAGNIYTANYNSNNVTRITPAGVSSVFGTTGTNPSSIAIDSAGNIYTANLNSNNVTRITPAGVSSIFATTGTAPTAIKIDSSGNIYTVNVNSSNVSRITPSGVSTILGTTGANASDLVIDTFGNIYTTSWTSNNVTRITPSGVSTVFGTTGVLPYSITIDSFGNIYTANASSNNVTRITPSGVSSVYAAIGSAPYGILSDSLGNIYTSNAFSNNVSKITPTVTTGIKPASAVIPNPASTSSDNEVTVINSEITNTDIITAVCNPLNGISGFTSTCTVTFATGRFGTVTFNSSAGSCTTPTITISQTSASCNITVSGNGTFPITYKASGSPSNSSSFSSFVVQDIDLKITKVSSTGGSSITNAVGTIRAGQALTYTINVTNQNTTYATNSTVTVSDVLPTSLNFVSFSASGWNCNFASGTATCTNTSPIAANSSSAIVINVTAKQDY